MDPRNVDELYEALEDMFRQFAYWNDRVGGYTTGGLSALEGAFEALGWDDPHPEPTACCDEPGCLKQIDCGTPEIRGLVGGRYRSTCWGHRPKDRPIA